MRERETNPTEKARARRGRQRKATESAGAWKGGRENRGREGKGGGGKGEKERARLARLEAPVRLLVSWPCPRQSRPLPEANDIQSVHQYCTCPHLPSSSLSPPSLIPFSPMLVPAVRHPQQAAPTSLQSLLHPLGWQEGKEVEEEDLTGRDSLLW
eukprot:767200-Hanusia_phi.AAC.2